MGRSRGEGDTMKNFTLKVRQREGRARQRSRGSTPKGKSRGGTMTAGEPHENTVFAIRQEIRNL